MVAVWSNSRAIRAADAIFLPEIGMVMSETGAGASHRKQRVDRSIDPALWPRGD